MKKNYRVIPTLLLKDRQFVKTKKFKDPVYLGDPINICRIFNDKFVDELSILNISNKEIIDFDYLQSLFSECLLPVSYGGKIKNIEEARNIFKCGADKIIFSSNLIKNKNLVVKTVEEVGSQGVVGCLNILKVKEKFYLYLPIFNETIYIKDFKKLIEDILNLGIGEIIFNFVNRDGMRNSYDFNFIKKISNLVTIPLIVLGGANSTDDFKKAIESGANAVAASSFFVFLGKRNAVLISYSK
jgi:cyclase